MIVEKLIEVLQELDCDANVVFEGEGDTCWTVRGAEPDDNGNFVMLVRGKQLPVLSEDDAPAPTGSKESP